MVAADTDIALIVAVHEADGVLIDKVAVAPSAVDDDTLQGIVADNGHLPWLVDDECVCLCSYAAK